MTDFTWKINNLERNTSDGGVVVVHYAVDGIDGEFSQGAYGTMTFTPDASADSFIPFDNLTEEVVLGWVKSALNVPEIEAAIQAKIDEQKTPATVAGMPW